MSNPNTFFSGNNTQVPDTPTDKSLNDILSKADGSNNFNPADDSLEAISDKITALPQIQGNTVVPLLGTITQSELDDIQAKLVTVQADLDNPTQYKATGFSTPTNVTDSESNIRGGSETLETLKDDIAAIGGGGGAVSTIFTSNGTFTPSADTLYDVLIVGGGAGGSGGASDGSGGGGGGAGGAVFMQNLSIQSAVSVVIGAGGAGGNPDTDGWVGSDSTFGTLVVAEGGVFGENTGPGGAGGGAVTVLNGIIAGGSGDGAFNRSINSDVFTGAAGGNGSGSIGGTVGFDVVLFTGGTGGGTGSSRGGGGGGGASYLARGGNGGGGLPTTGGNGVAGTLGSGGGGGGEGGTTGGTGGAGGTGYCIVISKN